MDLHIYTRKLLDKHLLPELKEIAQVLGIIPEGNKTRRETWVAALVGQPFPVFRSLETQAQEPIETPPGVEVDPVEEPIVPAAKTSPATPTFQVGDLVQSKTMVWGIERKSMTGTVLKLLPRGGVRVQFGDHISGCGGSLDFSESQREDLIPVQEPIAPETENSPGVEFDPVQEPLMEAVENPPGVDRVQEPIEFDDLESALAEIARLRTENEELLGRVRSQSEEIRRAKDISPVEKPSLKRVITLAQAACLDVLKSTEGNWILSMGRLRRSFKKLRDIWDLLISDDWYLMDLFSPPPPQAVPKPLFAPARSRYSAIPFCDDGLIDNRSLGVNVASSGRSPPAGGEAM